MKLAIKWLGLAFAISGCNAILDIGEPEHRSHDAAVGGSGAKDASLGGGGSKGGTGGVTGGGGTATQGGTGGQTGGGGISGSGQGGTAAQTGGGGTGGGSGGFAAQTGGGGSGGTAAQTGGGGTGGTSCTSTTHNAAVSADSVIFSGQCSQSIEYGGFPYGNIGVGRGILRFTLDPTIASLLLSGKVTSITLKLQRSVDCENDVNGCKGTQNTGTFDVFPLRNDWIEGVLNQPYSGADWCRRMSGSNGDVWKAPGASDTTFDHGALAKSIQIAGTLNDIKIPLDPTKWNATWVTNNQISMLIVAQSGTLVYATRESAKYAHPNLDIVVCN